MVNYFRKRLHRRCWAGFSIRLWITSLLKHIECQRTDLQSLFSVKLNDNSKILIVLYYHDRSTSQRGKTKNRETKVKSLSWIQVIVIFGMHSLPSTRFIPWNLFFLTRQTLSLLLSFIHQADPYFVNSVDMCSTNEITKTGVYIQKEH